MRLSDAGYGEQPRAGKRIFTAEHTRVMLAAVLYALAIFAAVFILVALVGSGADKALSKEFPWQFRLADHVPHSSPHVLCGAAVLYARNSHADAPSLEALPSRHGWRGRYKRATPPTWTPLHPRSVLGTTPAAKEACAPRGRTGSRCRSSWDRTRASAT